MKEPLESFDIDGLIQDLISDGYHRFKQQVGIAPSQVEPVAQMPQIDLSNAVFVFDRLDENSLVAAGLLKKYADAYVIEYDQIDKVVFNLDSHIVWLGLQPLKLVASKMNCRHTAFIGRKIGKSVHKNVTVFHDDYDSIAETIIRTIIQPMYQLRMNQALKTETDERVKQNIVEEAERLTLVMKNWFGIGYLVSQFSQKTPTEEMVVKAFSIIRMVHEYLYYDAQWRLEVAKDINSEEQIKLYRQAVEESKKLLAKNLQTQHSFYHGKIITTQYINETSYRWYIMKRLISINGQIWRSPLVVTERLFFGDNKKQPIAA